MVLSGQILFHKEISLMRVVAPVRSFCAPSGRILSRADLSLLVDMESIGMIAWSDEEITFHSGFRSHVYMQGRNDLSDNPAVLFAVAQRLKDTIDRLPLTHGPQRSVIGIPTAGTQLAEAVSLVSYFQRITNVRPRSNPPIAFRSLRSVLKGHGKDQHWIDRADLERHSYVTVENVISTGAGMIENFERLEGEGYPTTQMHHVVFGDWDLGGIKNLAQNDVHHVHTLYHMSDIVAAYVHLGLWPPERYDDVERRLAAHQ